MTIQLTRRFQITVTATLAIALTIIGALIPTHAPARFAGACVGAFIGGWLVGGVRTSGSGRQRRMQQLSIALGWVAFAFASGAIGVWLFDVLPRGSGVPSVILAGVLAGGIGGFMGALTEETTRGNERAPIVATLLGFALSAAWFLGMLRAGHVVIGLVGAAVLYTVFVPMSRSTTEPR